MRALAALALLVPAAALACPVCGTIDNTGAYQWMTLVMSALPLAMIFTVVGVLVVKIRRAEK